MSDPTTGAAEAPPSKKPFYRKPWFWAVAAIAGIMIATSSGGDEGGTPVADSTPATSSTASAEDEAAAQEARDAYFADTPTPTTEASTVAEPSAVATTEPAPEPAPVTTEAPAPAPEPEPVGDGAELQAMSKALDYLDYTSFSRKGLIDQLVFEGFSTSDATFAVDNTQTDWNQQAAKKAEEYLGYTSFSRSGLVEQLVFEGFTPEQAEYGASQAYPGG